MLRNTTAKRDSQQYLLSVGQSFNRNLSSIPQTKNPATMSPTPFKMEREVLLGVIAAAKKALDVWRTAC